MITLDSDPLELVRHSQAVATITGTIGWEAMVIGKPVIAFGLTWYEYFDGVLKVTNEETASEIVRFIETFKFDKQKLFAYLLAFSRNSTLVYSTPGIKEVLDLPEDECIDRLVRIIRTN